MREGKPTIRQALERCWEIYDRGGVVHEHERAQYKEDLSVVIDFITPAIILDKILKDEEIEGQNDA